MTLDRAIEARGLARTYTEGAEEVRALAGVDLTVEAGEFVAVMGPSGSGKSTLLHLVGGLDWPDAGDVRVEGQALGDLSDEDLARLRRRRIGFVLQFFNLLPTMTALENVSFPMMIDGQRDTADRARAALARVHLEHRWNHHPSQLSGGEQQRVAIARAIVTRPAIVLADEPTGALDSLTGEDVLRLLREVADAGQAVLMITHEARAAAYADRIVRLRDGLVVPADDPLRVP